VSRYSFTIHGPRSRAEVLTVINKAPDGARVEIKAAKRTQSQNDRFWAMLTDVARQLKWHGLTLRPDDWKLIFMNALKRERRMVPNIDGDGFVDLGTSSSDLSKSEMGDLMELIAEFGARHGVKFHDDEERAA
jgi:hypothetical protein